MVLHQPADGTSAGTGGCFFLDQEHPPNDGEAQPRLTPLFPHAADVATQCLRLAEQRDELEGKVVGIQLELRQELHIGLLGLWRQVLETRRRRDFGERGQEWRLQESGGRTAEQGAARDRRTAGRPADYTKS